LVGGNEGGIELGTKVEGFLTEPKAQDELVKRAAYNFCFYTDRWPSEVNRKKVRGFLDFIL
jgi:hypothetical protein